MLEPQIVEKPELKVVGLEAPFIGAMSPDANNMSVIGPLWGRFMARSGEIQHRSPGGAAYGVMYMKPPGERKHPHEMQYIAAAGVNSTGDIPREMVARTIHAGTFAVFTHRGPIGKIGETVGFIHRDWMPRSGYAYGPGGEIELYDQRFKMDSPESEMEIWVSVVPKKK